jgi:RimJ/RimL family protein N-acetyltransferase
MAVPALDTERLTLRGHRLEDYEECVALWSDPEVTRHIGGRPFTREEIWARLLRYVGHWELLGFGYWVIRERQSGHFVGEVGLADFRRELAPLQGSPEIGWVLAPWAHGRGLATEAASAVLEWGRQHFGEGTRFVCLIDPANAPSLRVADKLGFRTIGEATYHDHLSRLFERT